MRRYADPRLLVYDAPCSSVRSECPSLLYAPVVPATVEDIFARRIPALFKLLWRIGELGRDQVNQLRRIGRRGLQEGPGYSLARQTLVIHWDELIRPNGAGDKQSADNWSGYTHNALIQAAPRSGVGLNE